MNFEIKFILQFKWVLIPYYLWLIVFMHLMLLPYNKIILTLISVFYAVVTYIKAFNLCKKQQLDLKTFKKIIVIYPGIFTTIYLIILFLFFGLTGINIHK